MHRPTRKTNRASIELQPPNGLQDFSMPMRMQVPELGFPRSQQTPPESAQSACERQGT
jgi:hypothetical protein